MSDFEHNQGYIYPITNEEYEKLDEKYFDLEANGYDLEVFDGKKGLNRYLICTLGQFRMSLAIEGLTEIANQLKS